MILAQRQPVKFTEKDKQGGNTASGRECKPLAPRRTPGKTSAVRKRNAVILYTTLTRMSRTLRRTSPPGRNESLGAELPQKIGEVAFMRPFHGNL